MDSIKAKKRRNRSPSVDYRNKDKLISEEDRGEVRICFYGADDKDCYGEHKKADLAEIVIPKEKETVDLLTSETYISPAKLRIMQAEIAYKPGAAYQRTEEGSDDGEEDADEEYEYSNENADDAQGNITVIDKTETSEQDHGEVRICFYGADDKDYYGEHKKADRAEIVIPKEKKTVDLLTSENYISPAKLRIMQAEIEGKTGAAYQRIEEGSDDGEEYADEEDEYSNENADDAQGNITIIDKTETSEVSWSCEEVGICFYRSNDKDYYGENKKADRAEIMTPKEKKTVDLLTFNTYIPPEELRIMQAEIEDKTAIFMKDDPEHTLERLTDDLPEHLKAPPENRALLRHLWMNQQKINENKRHKKYISI